MESIENSLRDVALSSSRVDEASGDIHGEFIFAPDFPAFAGHFPGHPVLPAIVQLAAVRVIVSATLGKRVIPLKIVRVKFKSMIGPGESVRAVVKCVSEDESRFRLSFVLEGKKGTAASGEMICGVQG